MTAKASVETKENGKSTKVSIEESEERSVEEEKSSQGVNLALTSGTSTPAIAAAPAADGEKKRKVIRKKAKKGDETGKENISVVSVCVCDFRVLFWVN